MDEEDMFDEIKRSVGSSLVSDIKPIHEAAKASGKIGRREGERGTEFNMRDVRKWLKDQQTPRWKKRGGPTTKWGWDRVIITLMARYINNPGSFPQKQSDLEKAIQDLFHEDGDTCPTESVVREKAKLIFTEVKATKADN